MPGLTEKIRSTAGWWIAGLARALMPGLHQSAKWQAMLVSQDNQLKIWFPAKAAPVLAATLDQNRPETLDKKIQRRLKRIPPEALVLRLTPSSVVTSTLDVPSSGRSYIDAILRNQIERKAPWPIDKAIFGWRLVGEDPDRGQLKVQLAVTNRDDLMDLTAQARQLGANAGVVDCGSSVEDREPVAFISSLNARISRAQKRVRHGLVASLLAAMAAAAWGGYLFVGEYQKLATLETAIADVQRTNDKTSSLNAAGDQIVKRAGLVINRRKTDPAAVAILEAVSRALPDDSWLDSLEVRQSVIYMAGRSRNAAAVISALEAAPELTQVAFNAPLVRTGNGLQTFAARANIAQRPAREADNGQ